MNIRPRDIVFLGISVHRLSDQDMRFFLEYLLKNYQEYKIGLIKNGSSLTIRPRNVDLWRIFFQGLSRISRKV